jgi:ketosteroid isomerase-like protein
MGGMKTTALVIAAIAASGCASSNLLSGDMEPSISLAAAETAFAAHSVREDMRAAFLANFAEDGVFVRAGWTPANVSLRDQPSPPIVLDWRPAYVETAGSGDFGLSTGPWKITSKSQPGAAPTYGQFVSVWKREGSGPWKVAVDLGVGHPESVFWDRALETAVVRGAGSPVAGGIATAELRFARDARFDGARAAYRIHGADNLRFYRNSVTPVVGRAAAISSPAMNDDKLIFNIERTESARSGDFGYARGSYAAASTPAAPLGYFMRVWRLESGEWKVALDVTNPVR